MKSIQTLQEHWDALGTEDPLWAILSEPAKREGRWDLVEFLETGRSWIAQVMGYLDEVCPGVRRDRALDFGCGVGRLTQALAEHFASCEGIDIAPSMIRQAQEFNRFGSRCSYHVRRAPDLALYDDRSFDFVYTFIVLQHMPPALATGYIREFVRVLRPRGALIFQIPADRVAVGLVGGAGASRQLDVVPRHALRATLRLKHTLPSPLTLDAAKQISLEVACTNSGGRVWPALGDEVGRFELKLANRWLDDAGNVAVAHDGRTLLPYDVEPNMALTLPLLVTTPSEPGTYTLEIAIVQDGVGDQWHAGDGCEAGPVEVVAPVPAASGPQIQMFALSRPCVLDVLSESGAEVIDVRSDEAAGPHFRSYTYCATKSEINDSTSAPRAGT